MRYKNGELLSLVDEKTRLAGSNKMELLLFTMGGSETYGINVFKIREVCALLPVTRTPHTPPGVEGIISLRGNILPVINLGHFLGLPPAPHSKLIITEFSGHIQAFLACDVDRIVRVSWEQVRVPQAILSGESSVITAITELPDGKLVSIIDVEQILHDAIGEEPMPTLEPITTEKLLFFVDDSIFARKKIAKVVEAMGLRHQDARNGREAWEQLQALAEQAEQADQALEAELGVILVDAEMPEMDGYTLTRLIKADPRFQHVPVVMHSSLSSMANRSMGLQAGVNAYVTKFDVAQLSATIRREMAA